MSFTVATFYHFAPIDDPHGLRDRLDACMHTEGARGVVLIATEGINGTLAARPDGVDALIALIRDTEALRDLEVKTQSCDRIPFRRAKVRVKPEIVALRVPGVDPRRRVGEYVEPEDWNALVDDPDVILVDTRNDYEIKLGSFLGAINPGTRKFNEFPDYVARELDPTRHRKVAMFCTGGIRCEKATAFMLDAGFEEVYHLRGGILGYLDAVPRERSRWRGDCFVFDRRVALDHDLQPAPWPLCARCGQPYIEAVCDCSLPVSLSDP